MIGTLLVLSCFWASGLAGFDVLMVIGGRYYDHARNAHIELSSVEVIGPSSTCLLPDLPESRHGHSAARVGDQVLVCGGLSGRHIHERRECFIYSALKQSWKMVEEPAPAGLAFSGMGSSDNCVYVVGGRENLYTADGLDRTWKHSGAAMEYCTTRSGINAWRFLANLSSPVSDGCAAVVDGRLWLVGGESEVSLLGPAAKKWKENVADEPIDLELTNMALKPALQHPLPKMEDVPWWEEGQSLQQPTPQPNPLDMSGQPWQYWQGQVAGGYGGQGLGPGNGGTYMGQRNNNRPGGYMGQQDGGGGNSYGGYMHEVFGQSRGDLGSYVDKNSFKTNYESFRPQRRYDGNPYSKLRNRKTRSNSKNRINWIAPITRAPFMGEEPKTEPNQVNWEEEVAPITMKPPKVRPVGQGCHTTHIGSELGLFIAGGFQGSGKRVKWLPMSRPGRPMVEELDKLVEARRWAPSVGGVGDSIVVAGGCNWGCNTIEVFSRKEKRWRSGGRMRFRREYAAAVTVDSSWFPQCNFTLT